MTITATVAASNGKQNFARYMIGGLCLILLSP